MRPPPDSKTLPRDRVRRVLAALLLLCLVLLPLYLWPLRGRLSGLPGEAALSGTPSDPRNPGALARIPAEVWDALMGRRENRPPPSPPPALPRNLTMIATLADVPGAGGVDPLAPSPHAPLMTSSLGGSTRLLETAGEDSSSSSPVQFLADPSSSEPGTGNVPNGFGSGGYPGLANLGPWSGGGGSGGGGANFPASSDPWTPTDPGTPTPTPEPTTIVLVGSNLALLGAMAWRRRRRGEETHASG